MPSQHDEIQALHDKGALAEQQTLWRDAIDAYEQALTLAAGDASALDEAAVLTSLGRCYWNVSDARTAWRTLRRAIAMCQQRGDAPGQARATLEILRIWGPPDRQRAMADEAITALGPDGDAALRCRLLMRSRWSREDPEAVFNQAIAMAEQHGVEDVLVQRTEDQGYKALEDGRIDDGIALILEAHEGFARLGIHEGATMMLRNAGFNTLEAGRLGQGYELAERAYTYALRTHLVFQEHLALADVVGVAFAREDYAACDDLMARVPEISDIRFDFYKMWIAQARGDIDGGLRHLVDPQRGGGAITAVGQIHAAAASGLHRAGRDDAAKRALEEWARVERPWAGGIADEAPAVEDCLFALGDDALIRRVSDAFSSTSQRNKDTIHYSPLQGRAVAPVRGRAALHLGEVDEAERVFREGLAWCVREHVPDGAERCRAGLAAVATARAS